MSTRHFQSAVPHRQLLDGLLQPEADERGQRVVEEQQHDGIHKVVPLTLRVHHELPCVGAVALDDGGDAKRTAETDAHGHEERNRLFGKELTQQ